MTEPRSEQRCILIWLLGQIYRAEQRKKHLNERLLRISAERNAPIGGVGYDALPRSTGTSEGAASILLKMAEIEERIYAQKEEIDRAIVRVMDILDHLPVSSLEREICELRHIDMMQWHEISDAIPMSRSQCHKHYNLAIDMLMQDDSIITLVNDSKDDYWDWYIKKENARKK